MSDSHSLNARPQEQVEMVGRNAVDEQTHDATGDGFAQAPEERVIVTVDIEDGEPSVAATQRVINKAAFGIAE